MDKIMYDLKDMLKREIQKVVDKGDITPSEMPNVYNVICSMEKICRMEQIESEMYDKNASGRRFAMNYDDEKRMRNWDYPMSHDMSRDDRLGTTHEYSNHSIKDRMIDSFERMMDSASSDYERQEIQNWIMKMRNEK